ncbi:outer membrane protein transport protein [bacterium]|nr:outer membrane protein transport protein [bacterium]
MKRNVMIILIVLTASMLFSTNGMNMIGYGPRSSAMGGFSLGLLDDANSVNTNPAAIAFFKNKQLDINLGLLIPKVNFENSINDVEGESQIFPLPNFSYVHGANNSFTFGLGVYSQGGMGATYKDVKHDVFRQYDMDPMTPDDPYIGDLEYHSMIAYFKIMPTLAYQINPHFSLGISPSFGYAMMEMKMPYSILPSEMVGVVNSQTGMTFGDMFGAHMDQGGLGYQEITAYADMGDGATAMGIGARVGASYRLNESFTLGFSYSSKSTLTLEGDASMDMTAQFGQAYERMVGGAMQQGAPDLATAQEGVNQNLSDMGIDMSLGMIAEYDAEIEISWPQEVGIGFAYKANSQLLLGADFKWIGWKASMEEFKMKFNNGNNQNINTMMGSEDLEFAMPMDWEDQFVIALGAEYAINPMFDIRAGYNFGNNPVPEETVIPIFPAVVENHITMGLGVNINQRLSLDMAYELNLNKELEVNESKIANEYDYSTSSLSENVLHFGISYKL